ncbi:histone deacetylase [Fischerella thermalis]|jgi:acetoin utilization deacetylase AcuC-like enzyme|uniref:Histone deacetylase superfamily n=1 Tax=Fischerella thermalis JSC-11 TaxID=741277 RepID=G6FQA7_9CYAN|nr:histone deacetylase [Fischerella thermalis]PMB07050.1 histone deacetylase [Fischerella thermalis CCMEE 5273]EHC17992.1 histone deacetylase superfamily [Fischerella thermalis JSC-11]PLZ12137.1 histone deacetylase [Fischerella thermalis WC114]PLZ14400.1 histone deacetylase [Fischerella thermalis WC119]PLZ18258.1 histone deacetylase [Fischerella thermalis WC1110]
MFTVIYSDEFLDHKTGYLHPEKPERLSAITKALKAAPFASQIEWRSPTPVTKRPLMSLMEKIHSPSYIKTVQELASGGGGYLDTDTAVSPRSYDVALLAVSAWLDGVDIVIKNAEPAFVLARPPGHHAERDYGMGFCLFANAAIAAFYALEQPDINRVAILDWDVHHGNGTQAIVEMNPQIAYCSLHQYPCYPGTGKATERGFHKNVLNIPIPPGNDIGLYEPIFTKKVVPFLSDFQPDLLIVSAGYDANAADPLAMINLQPQDYGIFTNYCLGITRRILFGLEGGYDLPALSQSVVATINQCLAGK